MRKVYNPQTFLFGAKLVPSLLGQRRSRSDGTDWTFKNPRIRIRTLSLDNILKWILCQTKNNKNSHHSHIEKIRRLFAIKNNKIDK